MHDRALGKAFRAIRRELGLRQADVAVRAGCAQTEISRLERGEAASMKVGRIRQAFAALDAAFVLEVRWRGGDLDRILDEDHAALAGTVTRVLVEEGWQVEPEVSYSVYGERGSIDLLAWHPGTRTLLVVEVKTSITSVEETIRTHDAKARLASGIWRERTGREAARVARLLVVEETSTGRRRVERHRDVLDRRYPVRDGRAIRAWLRRPEAPLDGLWFVRPAAARLSATRRRRSTPRGPAASSSPGT